MSILPRYALPDRESARNINVETKPRQVEAWLGRLPLSNPLEAAEELSDYLATLNAIEVSHDTRAKIVERLAPVAEEIVASLYEQYGNVPLPLQPKSHRNAMLAQKLLRGMADAYKVLLVDWLRRRFHLFGGNPAPVYLQRILLALQAVLEISFEIHDPVPEGIWVDLHQTYNYALRSGLKDVIPEGAAKMLAPEQIYKSALLMALADPYRLPQAEIPWARDIIARFSNLVGLNPAEESVQARSGLFLVDVNTDAPPKPVTREAHPTHPRWDLLLNTAELVKHLALIATQIKGREDLDKLGLPEAARDPAYPAMLHRLKQNLGASLQRQSQRRRHQDGREVEVCFGLKSVHHLIAPPSRGDTIHYGLASNEPPPVVLRCKTLNDSMGGLSLGKRGTQGMQIRVGDAVGTRQGGPTWSVGLVRWFRTPAEGEISFGVQLLSPQVQAIQLRRPDNGRQWPCLLLHPSPAGPQGMLLMAQPGCFLPEGPVEMRAPKGTLEVYIGKRIEATPSIEIFRFQPEAPAPTSG